MTDTGDIAALPTAKRKLDQNFKLVSTHTGIARLGSSAFAISVLWIALKLTGSPVIAGFADGMVSLPLFMSFAFGAYIDGMKSKRKLAVATSVARGSSMFILLLSIFYDLFWIKVIAIYSVAFLLGMTSDILNSIRATWIKQFLREDEYKYGSSLIEAITSVAQSGGYALSGVMLMLGTEYTAFGIAMIFFLSAFPLLRIRDTVESLPDEKPHLSSSILSGLRYIRESKILKGVIIIALFVNLAFGTIGIFFAYLVDIRFGLPALYYGILFFTVTVGIITGSLSASKISGKIGFYTVIFVFSIGILTLSMGFIGTIYIDYAITFAIGVFIGLVNVVIETGILKKVDQEMMGRVNGAFSTFALSVTFLSGGIGGVLISFLTLEWAFVLVGAVVAVMGIISMSFREYYNITI